MFLFQSTYLYKVRLYKRRGLITRLMFQSTYLYKVRLFGKNLLLRRMLFQSTYLYKVRRINSQGIFHSRSFNPRTYIRYDLLPSSHKSRHVIRFNPRTYIRYDRMFFYQIFVHYKFQSTYLYKVRRLSNTTFLPKS